MEKNNLLVLLDNWQKDSNSWEETSDPFSLCIFSVAFQNAEALFAEFVMINVSL